MKVCQRNPLPETYYYLVIAPKGYINSPTSSYDVTDVTMIRFRQFPVDEILAVSPESYTQLPHPNPQCGTHMNRLDEPYNFLYITHFEKNYLKLLEVKICVTAP